MDEEPKTLIDVLKENVLAVAKEYGNNIHVELDVNPNLESVEGKITEKI